MILPIFAYQERAASQSALGAAPWTTSNVTVTSDTTVAPDGTTTADTINDADAVNLGSIQQDITVPNDSLTRIASVYIKAGTAAICAFKASLFGGTPVGASIAFNPANGLFTAALSLTAAPTQVGVFNAGSGWWRIAFPIPNNSSGNTTLRLNIYPAYAAALSGSGLGSSTASDGTRTGTTIAWKVSVKDQFIPTYPPIGKDLADELDFIRDDSTTTSGILQTIYERTETFKNLPFKFVPQADIASWQTLINFAGPGNAFTYYPDSTDLATFNDYQMMDPLNWRPARVAFGHGNFVLRLRQVI